MNPAALARQLAEAADADRRRLDKERIELTWKSPIPPATATPTHNPQQPGLFHEEEQAGLFD